MATRLEILERNLTRAKIRYHVDAQIRRVLAVFVGALGVQLATGTHDWTWKGLLAVAAAAAYVTVRQVWPTVPWSLVLHHVEIQKAQEVPASEPALAPDAGTGPPSSQTYEPVTKPQTQSEPPGDVPPTAP